MASSPSYGDLPPLQGSRRSFITPHRQLSYHERAGLETSDSAAEILYSHSRVRIISFEVSEDSIVSKSNVVPPNTDYPIDTIETLPWRSKTETLSATGLMIIEKVQGSSYFLKSGNIIRTIMPNSQCWCVDGESKFVLRKRKFCYYRIELPTTTPEEKEKVEELKCILPKVLRYERTPCPFIRAFHVELPEDAITPRRKGPWKRREASLNSIPDNQTPNLRKAKNLRTWSMQNPVTPLSSHGTESKRESDYGFPSTDRLTPSPGYSLDGMRSRTPSSIGSREDADDHETSGQSSDSGMSGQEAEVDSQKARNVSEPQEDSPLEEPEVRQSESVPTIDVVTVQDEDPKQLPIPSDLENTPNDEIDDNLINDVAANLSEKSDVVEEISLANDSTLSSTSEMDNLENTAEAIEHEPEDQVTSPANLNEHDDFTLPDDNSIEASADTDNQLEVDPHEQMVNDSADNSNQLDSPRSGERDLPELPNDQLTETNADLNDTASIVSSVDSFHTMNSPDEVHSSTRSPDFEDFDKTPLAERLDPLSIRTQPHKHEISELTVTGFPEDAPTTLNSQQRSEMPTSSPVDRPSTPTLDHSSASEASWSDVQTPSSNLIREGLRRRLKFHRSMSPLPSSANVFSTPRPNQTSHLASAILQKACSVVLVNPIEVVVLLVHVVARIAGGATVNDLLSGDLFRRPEHSRKPSNFPESIGSHVNDMDEEDDFAVPYRGRKRSSDTAVKTNDTDVDSIYGLD